MYYPYFRGKQNELITIRENAQLLKDAGFVPIIEPVKNSLSGLTKAITAIVEAEGRLIVIINPFYGDHSNDDKIIFSCLQNEFDHCHNISAGILLTEQHSVDDAIEYYNRLKDYEITFIHAGFTEAKLLAQALGENITLCRHIFQEEDCGKLYQKHFRKANKVLLRDGFEKRTNRKHPPTEFFSDLHATYEDENMEGFGDFLIVGNDYSEGGGPAYSVAIHLTFIDPEKDYEMHVHHFKSIRQDDPKDPAGKFGEALDKMINELNRPNTKILHTSAVSEFVQLHKKGHFPGLGYVKKLSMRHHIETLANYFETQ